MTTPKFGEGPRIVVADGNPYLCAAVRESLASRGHPDAVLCHSGEAVIRAMDGQIIDLLLLDDQLPGIDLSALIRRIRCRDVGLNPYVTIVATIGERAGASAKSALDAGVDELIAKPITVERFFNRVSKTIQQRRQFVVSPSYIGPTRRRHERGDNQGVVVRPAPNSLRSCVVDMSSRLAVDKMVARATEGLRGDIFNAAVREIDQLVGAVSEISGKGASREDWLRPLDRLTNVAESMSDWYEGPSKTVVDDLAGMLATLAHRIRSASSHQRVVEVDLLVQLNQAVPASLDVDQQDLRAFNEIAKMIAAFTGGT